MATEGKKGSEGMRILVACEFSGVVRHAFRVKGHDAWSCDILPAEDGDPHHVQGDARELLSDGWDMLIAFPPCTDLCSSGAVYWPQKQADGRQQRAVEFVKALWNAPIERVCIENPVGILSRLFAKPSQIIHPYHFGQPFMKKTCLWLRGLPLLQHTNVVAPTAHWHGGARRGGKRPDDTRKPAKLPTALKYGWKERSRTFQGIANAMAAQWSAPMPAQLQLIA